MNRPKSLSRRRPDRNLDDARKDLAVHASLSSNQIVKEPAQLSSKTDAPPSRSISLSRPQQANRRGRSTNCLSGTTKQWRRANSGPAAGGRGDIFTGPTAVNTAILCVAVFIHTRFLRAATRASGASTGSATGEYLMWVAGPSRASPAAGGRLPGRLTAALAPASK